MAQQNADKGFTIIEVVLVLAIAGLILLMALIVWPTLQRSQRDTQRRDDVVRFVAQVNSYATNNKGSIPKTDTASINYFLDSYMKRNEGEFKDPQTGNNYTVATGVAQQASATTEKMIYATSARCDGETIVAKTGSPRSFAIKIQLEGSGAFCKDNQS